MIELSLHLGLPSLRIRSVTLPLTLLSLEQAPRGCNARDVALWMALKWSEITLYVADPCYPSPSSQATRSAWHMRGFLTSLRLSVWEGNLHGLLNSSPATPLVLLRDPIKVNIDCIRIQHLSYRLHSLSWLRSAWPSLYPQRCLYVMSPSLPGCTFGLRTIPPIS